MSENIHAKTVEGFGDEWHRFDQTDVPQAELAALFEAYFAVFPWDRLSGDAAGFDLGCGSGRWARFVAPRVGTLHCVDPSSALDVARRNLAGFDNVVFHSASVSALPFPDESMDFAYSLGVLHHVPDTAGGIRECVRKLKPGAPLLLYLYYAFDNRPAWFRAIWRASDAIRRIVSSMPARRRQLAADALASAVYLPLARSAKLLEVAGIDASNVPLYAYRNSSFYTMRTDALDRFGTQLEQRFTAAQIVEMMTTAGLTDIVVSSSAPFWCAVGTRSARS